MLACTLCKRGVSSCAQLIDRTRIVIVPSLNPDGREVAQERGCTSKVGQTNIHGKDLDTDFTSKAGERLPP